MLGFGQRRGDHEAGTGSAWGRGRIAAHFRSGAYTVLIFSEAAAFVLIG